MKKLSLKNSDNLTVDEAFADFKGHCRIKNLAGKSAIKNEPSPNCLFGRFFLGIFRRQTWNCPTI